jgi:hypothetical protein
MCNWAPLEGAQGTRRMNRIGTEGGSPMFLATIQGRRKRLGAAGGALSGRLFPPSTLETDGPLAHHPLFTRPSGPPRLSQEPLPMRFSIEYCVQ